MLCAAVCGRVFKFFFKTFKHFNGDGIYSVVVVSVFGEIAFDVKVSYKSVFSVHGRDFCVFYRRKRIGYYRKSGDAAREETFDHVVVQSHLYFFVCIFVVHIVNYVEGVDVKPAQPLSVFRESGHNLDVIEFTLEFFTLGCDLNAVAFVFAAVESEEQQFGEVASRAEELHLFADFHCRNTARYGVIVAVHGAHHVVVFVLYGIRVDGDLRAELLNPSGSFCDHRIVRFGSGAEPNV